MSFWDYVLPWKAIPNMVKDVKKASTLEGKGKYDSVFGAIGKYADPFGAALGGDVQDFMHGTIPREVNRAVQPWNEFHMKYLDPLTMSGAVGKDPMKAASYKGGDLTAAALGLTAAGMMTGGFGLGGGGGTGGGSGGSSMPWSQNWSAMDWSDPNTYMQLGQQYGGMMPQGQQQAYQPPPQQGLLTDPEEERKRREREYLAQLQNYGYSTYGLLG